MLYSAFGLAGLTHLIERGVAKQGKTTSMLVVAPTRELAMQVCTYTCLTGTKVLAYWTRELAMQSAVVLEKVGGAFGVKTVCIYGGAPKHEQKALLKAGCQVLVATPGRLMDFMQVCTYACFTGTRVLAYRCKSTNTDAAGRCRKV